MLLEKEKTTNELKKLKKIINLTIDEFLLLGVSTKFKSIIHYQITNGGKRLRPILAILTCQLLGGKLKDVIGPAAGLEILHNYTLIIDDIIDHSLFRRNQPTTWVKYGKSIAECIAIDYGAAIFQAVGKAHKSVEISNTLAMSMKKIIEGEILDILFERRGREDEPYVTRNRPKIITKRAYLDMIAKKTASLFEASCEVGGLCGQATKKQILALKDYGFNLGMAFQIRDDILDIFGSEKKFGKKIGGDIKERKGGNIVLLYALQNFNKQEKKELINLLKKKKINQQGINRVVKFITKTKARQEAEKLQKIFAEKARQALRTLSTNKHRKILELLIDFVIKREK